MEGYLSHIAGTKIIFEDIHRPVAVGDEIDAVFIHPYRTGIIGVFPWDFRHIIGFAVKDPDAGNGTAAIMLPGMEGFPQGT